MDGKRKRSNSQDGVYSKKMKRDDDAEMIDAEEYSRHAFDGDVFEIKNAATVTGPKQPWRRPEVENFQHTENNLVFQQLDIDELVEPCHKLSAVHEGSAPVIRVFGVTDAGLSVCVYVHGFHPYLFVSAPKDFDDADCGQVRSIINDQLEMNVRNQKDKVPVYCQSVEVVWKETIMGFHGNKQVKFLKVMVTLPRHVATARRILEGGVKLGNYGVQAFQTYESNIGYTLRFMIDQKIVGCNWIELPAGRYFPKQKRTTVAQMEFNVSFDNMISHAPEGLNSRVAPFRILSFDIECAGRKGVFPDPKIDKVIQIANMVTLQGEKEPRVRNVFVLDSCAPINGTSVVTFSSERDLLRAWKDFVQEVDPDILTGYNIVNFDLPYLLDRANALKVQDFPYLGRVIGGYTTMKDTTFSSKGTGTREDKDIEITGRIQFDMLRCIQLNHKLRSYTLNAVSAHFLGEQKEDVHHSIITELHEGTDETRRRLAVYCVKDAYLPQRLLDKLMVMYNYIEMARVTGVPLNYLLTRGQQIKVVSQLYRKAKELDLLIPALRPEQSDQQFEGATVIEPVRGYYNTPITTLDFASLYPSIMMAHNLCYSTLLSQRDASKLADDDYIRTPTGALFVKESQKKGVLPIILKELLDARKKAKADLKKETDPFKKAVLDGRQLALKISANSVYGFTGATVGKLPCLEISSSVTAFGRTMIEQTKQYVESHFTVANGYSHDAQVIYGDTDSVMIKFGVQSLEEAMSLGKEGATKITETFVKPIKLEFEKVYFPYLLINKKRYAGLYWTRPDRYDKMDTKGIETVRRDNCRLVKNLITTCLEKILIDRDVEGAIEHTKQVVSKLLQNKIDLSLLVISKSLSKGADEYENKQAHVELAERMRKRDAGSAPSTGDRVAYVIIKGPKGAKAYEKAEDPLWVLEHNLPIDSEYYLSNQLKNPLLRIFEPIMDNPAQLFSGEHTRTKSVPTPSTGGLMKFAKKTSKCLGCKTPLDKNTDNLCPYCKEHEPDLYMGQVAKVSELEVKFGRLWSQCQSCQGSLHQDVLCTSADCPIFYMRKRVQLDLKGAQETLARFDYTW